MNKSTTDSVRTLGEALQGFVRACNEAHLSIEEFVEAIHGLDALRWTRKKTIFHNGKKPRVQKRR